MPYKDKEQQRAAQQRHYRANKDKYLQCRRSNRGKRIAWFRDIKAQLCCIECGFQDERCLDFHHNDESNKLFDVSDGVKLGYSESNILEEAKKCSVLCSNCHLKKHAENRKHVYHRNAVANNVRWLDEYKSKLSCEVCGIQEPVALCFHHIHDEHKWKAVSVMVHNGCSVNRLLEEISKCTVLCSNCHRIKHNGNVWGEKSSPRTAENS